MNTIWIRQCLAIGTAATLTLLSGCASQPMRVALTEMGTTSDSEYGVFSMRLQRGVTITGLGPEETVGTLSSDSDKFSIAEQLKRFWPTRNDLPDAMTPRFALGDSEIHVRSFGTNATIDDLMRLRDLLQQAQQLVAAAAQAEIKTKILQTAIDNLTREQKTSGDLPANVKTALQSLYSDLKLVTVEDLTQAVKASTEAAVALNGVGTLAEIRTILTKKGIVITQWQGDTTVSAQAGTSVGGGGIDSSRTVGGYLILGAPQVHTLHIGNDIRKHLTCTTAAKTASLGEAKVVSVPEPKNDDDCVRSKFASNREYMTIYQIRARHLVYTETSRSTTRAGLQLKLDELAKLASAQGLALSASTLEQLKASVDISFAAIQSAGSSGVLDASTSMDASGNASTTASELKVFKLADLGGNGKLKELVATSVPVVNMRVALKDKISP